MDEARVKPRDCQKKNNGNGWKLEEQTTTQSIKQH